MKKLTALVLALLLCLTATFAMADAWKAGDTVTFVVPAKAGGGSDLYTTMRPVKSAWRPLRMRSPTA